MQPKPETDASAWETQDRFRAEEWIGILVREGGRARALAGEVDEGGSSCIETVQLISVNGILWVK